MRILITGFEPFGSRNINISGEVAKAFEGKENINVILLPVSFKQSHIKVIEAIDTNKYDIILLLGETSVTKDCIRLERLAINFMDSINPDNDGIYANEEKLIEEAPPAYFTKFPIKPISSSLREKGYKIKITNSAGTFVCNSLYFHVLHHIESHNLPQIALFIHLAASTEVISIEEMCQTIMELIKRLLCQND